MKTPSNINCEYSEMLIPNDPAYTKIVGEYVVSVAQKLGFDDMDSEKIRRAVHEAVTNVTEHAFEPSERAVFKITCERVPLGLKVTILDKGLPFDPEKVPECAVIGDNSADTKAGCGIFAMRESMDEVFFNNLGPGGKETVLIKYLRNSTVGDYHEACDLAPYPTPGKRRKPLGPIPEIFIRPMTTSDGVEVSRCVYRAYGYSYSNEIAYYPDRLVQLNLDGRIFSVVAVTAHGEIVGHAALLRNYHSPRIGELGMAVVKPEYRERGIFSRLSWFLIKKARSDDLVGIYGRAVSNHTFSQKMSHKLGMKNCAILLGHLPATPSFKGITERLSQRETLIVHFMYLQEPEVPTIYPPIRHVDIIRETYERSGAKPIIDNHRGVPTENVATDAAVRTHISPQLQFARIDIETYGENVTRQVRIQLKELCLQRIDTINLYLNLMDPSTKEFSERFEELGFFFAGILPGQTNGEALILQYLNNVPVDYSKIKVEHEDAIHLLSYIKRLDPNRISP